MADKNDDLLANIISTRNINTIYLEGKSPWGFRVIASTNSTYSYLIVSKVKTKYIWFRKKTCSIFFVCKVRLKSKAYYGALEENDIILSINNISTQNMNIQTANDLIDSAECLFLNVLHCTDHWLVILKKFLNFIISFNF